LRLTKLEKGYRIPCPWLKKKDGKYFCTAVTPPEEVNAEEELCLFPASMLDPTRPYFKCKRWRAP